MSNCFKIMNSTIEQSMLALISHHFSTSSIGGRLASQFEAVLEAEPPMVNYFEADRDWAALCVWVCAWLALQLGGNAVTWLFVRAIK